MVLGPVAAAALILTLKAGGRLFRILLAVAFGYLALQAIRNVNLLGLIAGFVIASGMGEWVGKVVATCTRPAGSRRERWGTVTRLALAGLIVLAIVAAATGRLPMTSGKPYALGLGEAPLTFAHEAARFAGLPGMPNRALAFNLGQTAVYLYHNSPERKPFMDPRLEVASKATFETYAWLDKAMGEDRPGWCDRVERMGVELILLDHNNQFAAEATLLAEPRWRCVFFDEMASVFLDSRRKDLEASYPTIDFAARHFLARPADRAARGPAEAFGESRGYSGAGAVLATRQTATWSRRVPILLLAIGRVRDALAVSPDEAKVWMTLGSAFWSLSEDLAPRSASPAVAWDPAQGLVMAQAIYACRRTIALEPVADEVRATLLLLKVYFNSSGMIDAGDWAGELLTQDARRAAPPDTEPARVSSDPAVSLPPGAGTGELFELFEDRLRHGRTLAAIELVRQAEARGIALPWKLADRVATAHLYLGEPAQARKYWERAHVPPSTALRLARIAQAELASTDFDAAEKTFRAALLLDPRLGEAWFGLALLELQLGHADATLAVCQQGLSCTLTEPQREALLKIKTLVDRFASSGRGSARASP